MSAAAVGDSPSTASTAQDDMDEDQQLPIKAEQHRGGEGQEQQEHETMAPRITSSSTYNDNDDDEDSVQENDQETNPTGDDEPDRETSEAGGGWTDPVVSSSVNRTANTTAPATTTAVPSSTTSGVSMTKSSSGLVASSNAARKRMRSLSPVVDAVMAAALTAASQHVATLGLHGLANLLQSPPTAAAAAAAAAAAVAAATAAAAAAAAAATTVPGAAGNASPTTGSTPTGITASASPPSQLFHPLPSVPAVLQAANKAIAEHPPWVHWSKTDMAPQLKVTDSARLTLQGPMRGYRMARASHGVGIVGGTTTAAGGSLPPLMTTSNSSAHSSARTGLGASSGMLLSQQQQQQQQQQQLVTAYYECWILPGPTAKEIANSLPANARLGTGLREQLQKALEWEEQQELLLQQQQQVDRLKAASSVGTGDVTSDKDATMSMTTGGLSIDHNSSHHPAPAAADLPRPGRKRKNNLNDSNHANAVASTGSNTAAVAAVGAVQSPPAVGGHLRIGWSMRTGDLQAPVGYDKWSYGIRDIGGSIIHKSQRQDQWGGEGFEAGDIVGCGIVLDPNDASQNHIRFFRNGDCMGQFVITKGKRVGGEAFVGIESGTYYPAVSCYMGGAVRANFGPYFVCPPRKLPTGLKFKPLSEVCAPAPLLPEQIVSKLSGSHTGTSTLKLFRKVEHQQALKDAALAEAMLLRDSYSDFLRAHISDIRKARQDRGLSVSDLPQHE